MTTLKLSTLLLSSSTHVVTQTNRIHTRLLASSIVQLTRMQVFRHLFILSSSLESKHPAYYHFPQLSPFECVHENREDNKDIEYVTEMSLKRAFAEYLTVKRLHPDQHLMIALLNRQIAHLIGLTRLFLLTTEDVLNGTLFIYFYVYFRIDYVIHSCILLFILINNFRLILYI